MTHQEAEMSKKTTARERFHDRVISLLLVAIWIVAALMVRQSNAEIPASMLLIGTVFFLMLVPAMKELVKIIDKRVRVQLGLSEPLDE
jgi:membrane-associated HD superfamily phosphohydrolase